MAAYERSCVPPKHHWVVLYVAILTINVAITAMYTITNAGYTWPLEVMNYQLDLAFESNVVVWFSSSQLLVTGLVAMLVAWLGRLCACMPRLNMIGWCGVGAVMLGISMDETSQLHEWLGGRYAAYVQNENDLTHNLPDVFNWLIVLSPLIVIVVFSLVWFVIKCLRHHRPSMYLAIGGLACWIGTLIAEYAEGRMKAHDPNVIRGHQASIEEGCELIGAALFLIAFLDYLRTQILPSPRA